MVASFRRSKRRWKCKSEDVDEVQLERVLTSDSFEPLVIYFLSDNRVLLCDGFESDGEGEMIEAIHMRRMEMLERSSRHAWVESSRTQSLFVEPSIELAERWMRRQTLTASNVGEENISTIYSDIIRRVATADSNVHKSEAEFIALRKSLHAISEQSLVFVALGMIPRVPLNTIVVT